MVPLAAVVEVLEDRLLVAAAASTPVVVVAAHPEADAAVLLPPWKLEPYRCSLLFSHQQHHHQLSHCDLRADGSFFS